jgi:Carboxypeptidase regulatory-like domain
MSLLRSRFLTSPAAASSSWLLASSQRPWTTSQEPGARSQKLHLWLCCLLIAGSSHLLAQASPQLPVGSIGLFRIAGIIVSASEGHPLSHARVSLQDVQNLQDQIFIVTGDDGHFEFANLHAGKYSLVGAKRGYITAAYDEHEQFSTAIVTGAGVDTENLTLRLVPTAVITGHVFDESGEPVRNAAVTLWRDDHSSGVSRTVRAAADGSDDQGAFEFAPLNAGTYFVSVAAKPWYAVHPPSIRPTGTPDAPTAVDRSLDVVYLPTYYAGATEVEDASPILIRGGDRFDLDLHLMPVPALHVLLRIPPPEGGSFQLPSLFKRDFDGPQQAIQPEVQMPAPGVVEITAAPGKYELLMPPRNNQLGQTSEVEITQDNQELDTSAGQALSNISAKVEVIGETAFPPQLSFALRNAHHRIVAWGEVNPAREVTFANVVPGNYHLVVGAASRAYSVISMKVNGSQVPGHLLTVPAGANLALSLSVAGGTGDINGIALRAGKGAAGAMIVLVPKDPEANHDLFRRDQSDLDGTFTFRSVIPGAYTAIAIENGWDLDWSKPAVLLRYVARGQNILVGGPRNAIQLQNPIEVQSK